MRFLLALWITVALLGATPPVEERAAANWPTANRFRVVSQQPAAPGQPLWVDLSLPDGLSPDSVRVLAAGTSTPVIPAKTDWRKPRARIAWKSTGAAAYEIYFDRPGAGERTRLPEPAMVGAGDRLTFGEPNVRGNLAVGLWAHPAPLDIDGDGDQDLLVGCPDRPYNGIWFFRNIGSNREPLYDRAEWLAPGKKDLVSADFDGDGALDLVFSGGYYRDVARNLLTQPVKVEIPRGYHIGRDDLWHPADWDGDGLIDLLIGVSDWREYGWDDAFDQNGTWQRGPLHGYVYFYRNTGSNSAPRYAEPVKLHANGHPIDRYGSPIPNPVDWFGNGRLDLLTSNFLDTIAVHPNTGTRRQPNLAAAQPLTVNGEVLHMDLCMIQPRVAFWHADGRPSLIVGEEDGTVSLVENLAPKGSEPRLAPPRYLQQVDPYVKSGALSRPQAVDWNGDGLLDLVAGNSAGYLQYFRNTGTRDNPKFVDEGYLRADGRIIRRIAGPNGSVQGPAEAKWGYSNPSVADWDLDGDLDILVNDIWGAVHWYRNAGTRTAPKLEAARPIEVEWQGAAPKPDWVWWQPKGKQLLTQWRTTPKVIDWTGDGLPDLVMLNHQGYLSLFRRERRDGKLLLLPPERIFVNERGRFLNLAAGRAGSSGRRKIEIADWDGDGDLDLLCDSDGGPIWYENTGTQANPVMHLRGTVVKADLSGHSPTPNVADWNGDGKLDLIVGAEDGFFYYFERSYIQRLAEAGKQ